MEAARFAELKLLERAGQVKEIHCQPQVELTRAKIIYKPDFLVTIADGSTHYEEVKGFETPEWRIKRRLWLWYGPGKLIVFKGSASRLFEHETLIPKIKGDENE